MEDYKNEIKQLIDRDYSTIPVVGMNPIYLTTTNLLDQLKGVVPEHPITDHDVYEVLKELNFKIKLYPIYEVDDEGKKTDRIIRHIYLWELFPKNDDEI